MNNSIIIKGADFSGAKVGNLNLTKLSVVKANDYCVHVSGGNVVQYSPTGWGWDDEIASSAVINVSEGATGIYGRFNVILSDANFNSYIASPNNTTLAGVMPIFVFYSERDSAWMETSECKYPDVYHRPEILGYKQGEYLNDGYTAVELNGCMYVPLNPGLRISKIVMNWIRTGATQCPELSIESPEVYLTY